MNGSWKNRQIARKTRALTARVNRGVSDSAGNEGTLMVHRVERRESLDIDLTLLSALTRRDGNRGSNDGYVTRTRTRDLVMSGAI